MRLKIVHVISGLNVGGAEMALYRLLSRTDHRRFESIVVCLIESGPVGEKIQGLGIPAYSLGMGRGRPSARGLLRLVRLLHRERPHIVQTWLYHADLLGLISARLAGIPTVVWNLRASNMDMAQYRPLSGWTVRACAFLSRLPRVVVVNSEAGQAFHARIGYRPRAWILIGNGYDLEQFRPDAAARLNLRRELGVESNALLIGLVARFDPMKDHATFLRAAGELGRMKPAARFVLAGEGVTVDNHLLSELIAQESLDGRVYRLGSRSDIPYLTAALDIASSSSAYGEGFPNMVAEAMACGVPCVVTDAGDSARIVCQTGVVVPPKNPQALAQGWQKLIEMGVEGRQQLGQMARERVRTNYSLEQVARRYAELYLSLVD